MIKSNNPFLIAAATLSALAALLHLGCIAFGAPWYRFLGAGEQMAQMAASGHWYPTVITLGIAVVLLVWSLYALSGAGIIMKLPLLRTVLSAITGFYLLRGIAYPVLEPNFPGNSAAFWIWSSVICFSFGVVHFIGLRHAWSRL